MRADPLTLIAVFGKDVRYVVPMFQRPYVWNMTEHWEPLWQDIRGVTDRLHEAMLEADRKGTRVDVPPHFLGAIVLDQMPTGSGELEARSVVDGQQRLATLQVFIAATRDIAEEHGLDQQARLLGKLLTNDRDLVTEPDDEFKVWPTNADREAFRAVMRNQPLSTVPRNASLKLGTAMQYFRSILGTWARELDGELDEWFAALAAVVRQHLKLVAIDLDSEDNAQVIFETLNARGTPLQAADLIKNLLFQMADREGASVEKLYEQYWAPFDRDVWRREVRQGRLMRPALDVFLSHWLAMTKEAETLVHQLFPAFRGHLMSSEFSATELMNELARSADTYREMERYPWRSVEGQFFHRQALMDTTTTIPLLLYIFGLDENQFPGSRRVVALKAIESFLVRRMLCRLTTKTYNRLFLDLLGEVKKRPAESDTVIVEFLRQQQGESQLWPTDERVREGLRNIPIYTAVPRSRVRLVLEAIEQEMRTDLTEQAQADAVLTIEHLLPQDWKPYWHLPPAVDQESAAMTRDRVKHTLGNLTLVTGKLNPSLSNGSWEVKKDALREHSVLRLNWSLLKDDPAVWDEETIALRTDELTNLVLQIWPGPTSGIEEGVVSGGLQVSATPVRMEEDDLGSALTDDDLVRSFLDSRALAGTGRMLAEALLGEVQSWPEVVATIGKSTRTDDGQSNYVMVHRRRSGVGAFMYVRPREDHLRLDFRLPREYVEGRDHAFPRDVKPRNVYQVRMIVEELDHLPEALDLASLAFENAT